MSDWWQESIHPETASVVATFPDGRPAILENRLGAGRTVYIGTRLDAAALRDTLLGAVSDAGVSPVVRDAPAFVEATRRGRYLFLLNHSDTQTATVRAHGLDLLSGEVVSGSVDLPPLAVRVIRTQ